VAIVGRPNVGKSAIFNRLVAKRVAIVHEQSGVTRDRIMHEAIWEEERFTLVDTGGIFTMDGARTPGEIEKGILQQVEAALSDASVAILVVDVTTGILPLDEEVARVLRQGDTPVVVAVNKCDHEARDADADVFAEFGFPVFPASALHNRGFGPLMDAAVAFLPPAGDATAVVPLRVAVVGRPNSGKSSYVNRLLRNERVIVSEVPGTTRDSIDVPFSVGGGAQARHYVLTDTAGLRRQGKVDSAVERYSHIRAANAIRSADVVILLLDAVSGPTAQDKKIASLVMREKKGCLVLVNKWDLTEDITQRQYAPALSKALPFMRHCPLIFVSAKTGYNIRRSIEVIDHVAAQIRAEIPTGILNRTIGDAVDRTHPPSVKGRQLHVLYATQVGVQPVRLRLFVNEPKLVVPAYSDYLVRIIRERFGLEGASVVLQFRSRREQSDRKKRPKRA